MLPDAVEETSALLRAASLPPVDEQDYAALGAEPGAATGEPASERSYLEELEKLTSLRDQGIISAEEFQAKMGQFLGL